MSYADVEKSVWADPVFMRLSPAGKTLFLWAISNEHSTLAGLYTVARPMIELATGLHGEAFDHALAEADDRLYYHEPTGTVWVPGRTKRLRIHRQPNTWKGILTAVAKCPHHPFAEQWVRRYSAVTLPAPKDAKSVKDEQAWTEVHTQFAELRSNFGRSGSLEPLSPKFGGTSVEVPGQRRGEEKGEREPQASVARVPTRLPAGLSGYLVPVAEALRRVAAAKPGAIEPTDAAVAKALRDFPNKDFVPLTADFEHYWLHGPGAPKPMKDVVRTWRNRADTQADVLRKAPATPTLADPAARRESIDAERERKIREASQ